MDVRIFENGLFFFSFLFRSFNIKTIITLFQMSSLTVI